MAFGDIGKVYSVLLSSDPAWITKMDENEDGIIIKAEFTNYLGNCNWSADTSKAEKEDLIDKFWKTFDVHRLMDKIPKSDIVNFNALDEDEMANMTTNVIDYSGCLDEYNKFILNITTPNGLNTKYAELWKNDIVSELNNYFNELFFVNNKPKDDIYVLLQARYDEIKYPSSIDYYALQDLEDTYKSKYAYSDELKYIIYAAINEIDISGKDASTVYLAYKQVVEETIRNYIDMLSLTNPPVDEPESPPEIIVDEVDKDPEYETTWSIDNLPSYLITNETIDVNVSASITKDGQNVDSRRISYEFDDADIVYQNGKITITAPAENGTYNLTINAIIDGKKIDSKVISLPVFKDTSNINNIDGTIEINNVDGTTEDQKISTLLKDKSHITKATKFYNRDNNYDTLKQKAKNQVNKIIDDFASILIARGYSPAQTTYAQGTMKIYYDKAIDSITDEQKDRGFNTVSKNITYQDYNGNSITETITYVQKTMKYESTAAGIGNNEITQTAASTTGILFGESYNKTNTYYIYFNTGVVLDNFIKFMNNYKPKK